MTSRRSRIASTDREEEEEEQRNPYPMMKRHRPVHPLPLLSSESKEEKAFVGHDVNRVQPAISTTSTRERNTPSGTTTTSRGNSSGSSFSSNLTSRGGGEVGSSGDNAKKKRPRRALALGMAFVNEAYAQKALDNVEVKTSSSPARDRARLLDLEALGPYDEVVSFNDGQSDEDTLPHHHFKGLWNSETAPLFAQRFCADPVTQPPFQDILLDYFRFPARYMHKAYGGKDGVLSFLYELERMPSGHQCIDKDTRIWIPNLPTLGWKDQIDHDQKHLHPHHVQVVTGYPRHVKDPMEQPLYRATAMTYARDQEAKTGLFGKYTNEHEIAQLEKDAPFLELRLDPTPPSISMLPPPSPLSMPKKERKRIKPTFLGPLEEEVSPP